MCGIAALLLTARGQPALIETLATVVAHRGRDDWGCVAGNHDTWTTWDARSGQAPGTATIALAHRRLSIVDLSPSGHQPMANADGSLWIVYNGEVYNHVELRAELEREGVVFRSHCDTEVILAAYEHWGEECLSRFNGMWGFVIWDRRRQRMFAARDRFGVKPLYYWQAPDGTLAFASEIKQFTVLPGWQARLNRQAAYDFLAWSLTDHGEGTCFDGVFQIPPGGCISLPVVDWSRLVISGRLPIHRWYHLEPQRARGDVADSAERLHALLTDAVRLRLRADVRVGSCLSGGLDSSSIVCVANRLLRQEGKAEVQHTVSAVSEDARVDESRWMDVVVGATGVANHRVRPDLTRLFDELPDLVWHQDEPFGSTSIYAQWCIFRLAREHGITVMLDGQGADEQLAGYHGVFLGPHLASLLRRGRLVEGWAELEGMKRVLGFGRGNLLQRVLDCLLPGPVREVVRHRRGLVSAKPAWLDLRALGVQPSDPFAGLGMREPEVDALCRAQVMGANLQMLLRWEDRNSMAFGVEARVPFLDYRLVEAVLGMPVDHKIHRGVTKRVLRQAMSGIVPSAILERHDKIGFATAEQRWLCETAPERFRAAVARAVSVSGGILGPAAVTWVDEIIAGRRAFDFTAWRMIVFGAWVERFGVEVR